MRLSFDPRPLLAGRRARIVANLPYNIATPLLISWLTAEPWPPLVRPHGAHVPARGRRTHRRGTGLETYGRLSVLTQWRTEPKILFDISPEGIHAAAESHVVAGRVFPARAALALRPACAERVTRSGLRPAPQDAAAKLEDARPRSRRRCWKQAGIAGTARAEDIPVEGFVRLARLHVARRCD